MSWKTLYQDDIDPLIAVVCLWSFTHLQIHLHVSTMWLPYPCFPIVSKGVIWEQHLKGCHKDEWWLLHSQDPLGWFIGQHISAKQRSTFLTVRGIQWATLWDCELPLTLVFK
jgi:hypothetical protein